MQLLDAGGPCCRPTWPLKFITFQQASSSKAMGRITIDLIRKV